MKSKKNIIIISVIALILLLTLGGSFAFFKYLKEGSFNHKITIGDLTFHYTEISGVGHGINLSDTMPMSDSDGKVLSDTGTYFDFSIEANLLNRDLLYEIVVEPTSDSTINLNGVKFYLTELDENDQEIEISQTIDGNGKVKTLADYDNTDITGQTGKAVYIENISAATQNYVRRFRARMWINEDIDWTASGYIGETGAFRINVYTNSNALLDAINLTYTSKINPDTNLPYTECTTVKCALDELNTMLSN